MGDSVPPVVNLQTSAIQLASRLSSLHLFLEAAKELLLTFSSLTCKDYRQHGRKIITLIEISRKTLTRAGLKLHTFTSCPTLLSPHKSAYFELLELLRRHRHDFAIDLNGRLERLLSPLSNRFIIRRGSSSGPGTVSPSEQSACCSWHGSVMEVSPGSHPSGLEHLVPRPSSRISFSLMPPPAPAPSPSTIERSDDASSRRWTSHTRPRSAPITLKVRSRSPTRRRRTKSPGPEGNQENSLPTALIRRPIRRHFGIFFTAQKSSCHKERAGRSMAIRAIGRA